ncbi:3-methyl-2-oxobutanoate dehydrogenase [Planoprotostelium fungivorum]|uniref:2-oxoisovalerate dehydrogenase subunit alpha n=1 Tax=Planoprotostelium fungivorum TaxID=1890364 RepID=A0A2P6NU56_9EUKA|nr:3-methyl-2-oxobutanoate dehydrogenase [Planoprotostelium fungivorum]
MLRGLRLSQPFLQRSSVPVNSFNRLRVVNHVKSGISHRCKSTEKVLAYPGEKSVFDDKLEFHSTKEILPTYRIMNEDGIIINSEEDPKLDRDTVVKMYRHMVSLNAMDNVLYDVQRQGRISFYMTNYGEEATHLGSAAALKPEDTIFAQYREAGVFLWRGFSLDDFMNQCQSNSLDYGKGRQMPVHYGSRRLNIQTISSPLATQIPQATGSAYAQKMTKSGNCTVCYFGEGAASEGDFHAAINFAATLETPSIFFCRNNRWAISTPSTEQYRGDGIAGRGVSYGLKTIRVDGNDIFAVYNATKAARKIAVEDNQPVMIEAMTYRVSHHSTSDDSTRYRTLSEIEQWKIKHDPVKRLYNYLLSKGWWSEEMETTSRTEARKEVLSALKRAEAQKKPSPDECFNDVYDELTPQLIQQRQEMREHVKKYPQNYPIDQHLV